MKIKPSILAVALALSAASAFAENQVFDVPLTGPGPQGSYTAGFDVQHLVAGAFEDTITFTPAVSGFLKGSLITTAANSYSNINFTSGSINGIAFAFSPVSANEWGFTNLAYAAGPLVLKLFGVAAPTLASGTAINAIYGGTLNVSAVPEPETYAMLLAGLGLFGFIASRRRRKTGSATGSLMTC
jgi:hypothetical protein